MSLFNRPKKHEVYWTSWETQRRMEGLSFRLRTSQRVNEVGDHVVVTGAFIEAAWALQDLVMWFNRDRQAGDAGWDNVRAITDDERMLIDGARVELLNRGLAKLEEYRIPDTEIGHGKDNAA
jgi:hypothetical protein